MQHFFCNFKTAENIIIQHKQAEEVSINNLILNEFKNDKGAFTLSTIAFNNRLPPSTFNFVCLH